MNNDLNDRKMELKRFLYRKNGQVKKQFRGPHAEAVESFVRYHVRGSNQKRDEPQEVENRVFRMVQEMPKDLKGEYGDFEIASFITNNAHNEVFEYYQLV